MTPDQMRDASLLELFSLEADAQTQVLSAGLLALERNPTQADQLEACMRAAHSLKGAARIVGVDAGVSVSGPSWAAMISMRGMMRPPVAPLLVASRPSSSTSDRHATSAPRTLGTPSKARER